MATNPYAAPQARVSDATADKTLDGEFVPEGQSLAAGEGWQWIVDAWGYFKAHAGLWIGMTLALGAIYIVASLIPYLGQLATTLFTPVFGAGILLGCRAIERGEPLEFGHLFAGFRLPQMGRLIAIGGISLVFFVLVFAIVFAFGGLGAGLSMIGGGRPGAGFGVMALLGVLVAAALSIPLYMALWFAPALTIFHDYDLVAALRTSFFACLKNVGPFLVYGLALMVLGVLAVIPLGLGMLVLGPVIMASVYTSYRAIFFVR